MIFNEVFVSYDDNDDVKEVFVIFDDKVELNELFVTRLRLRCHTCARSA